MLDRQRVMDYLCRGEKLAPNVEREILGHEDAVAPILVEILCDEDLAAEGSVGDGYAPIHAARLLGELRALSSVEPMIRRLGETGFEDILHNTLMFALPRLGAAVVEPALQAHAETNDADFQMSLAGVLSECDVRDDRIYEVLLRLLPKEPIQAAGCLWRYGDRRALEHLVRAFDSFRIERDDRPLANQTLIELRDAIEKLGGVLSPEQEAKYTVAMEPRARWRAQLESRVESAPRPSRNEPCWCGSAKKYKKCHLDEDENEARLGRQRSLTSEDRGAP